jgi:hypothetical protein
MPLNFDTPKTDYSQLFGGSPAKGSMGGLIGRMAGGWGAQTPGEPPPPNDPTQSMYSQNQLNQNLVDLDEEDGGWGNKFQKGFSDFFSKGKSYLPNVSGQFGDFTGAFSDYFKGESTLPGTSANFGIGNTGIDNNYNQPIDDYSKVNYGGQDFSNQLSQAWRNR